MESTEVELKTEERQRCEIWTRVMGYYRPISSHNIGKKGEHEERTDFIEPTEEDYAKLSRDKQASV